MSVRAYGVFRWLLLGAVVVFGGLMLGIAVIALHDQPWVPPRKWVGLVVWTLLIFGFVIHGAFFGAHVYDRSKALGPQVEQFLRQLGALTADEFKAKYPGLYDAISSGHLKEK